MLVNCQSQIYMVYGHTDLDHCVTLANIFGTEGTRIEVCASFYYGIEPLNLFDFIMNLIADFNLPQSECQPGKEL